MTLPTIVVLAALQSGPTPVRDAPASSQPARSAPGESPPVASRPLEREAALREAIRGNPRDQGVWLVYVDSALDAGQYAVAVARTQEAARAAGASAELHWRAARAYFSMRQDLGAVEVRSLRDGRVGQFAGDWLVLEPRPGASQFVCAPAASAIFHIRKALDAGLDRAELHLLHAQVWDRAGKPAAAIGIVRAQEAALLDHADADRAAALAEIALHAGDASAFLRYTRRRADLDPQRAGGILFDAYRDAAALFGQRGDDELLRSFLRRALDVRPDDPGTLLQLADAEWDADNTTAARGLYRRLISLAPQHPARARILDRLED